MNTKSHSRPLVVAIVASLSIASTASAWWGFGHYRVAIEIRSLRSDLGVNPAYAMVPDAFPSENPATFFTVKAPLGISVPFTWAHAVQRVDGELPPPSVPTYPNDGRFPGPVMYHIATQKMAFESDPIGRMSATNTAIGAVVHNAADNVVHWDYFRGDGGILGPNMWLRNHCTKEEWASYVLLMLLDGGVQTTTDPGMDGILGTDDDLLEYITPEELNKVFDPTSGLVMWQTIYGGDPRFTELVAAQGAIGYLFDRTILHMGMKAHRKNRRGSDLGGNSEFEVMTVTQIEDSILAVIFEKELHLELLKMTRTRWYELDFKSRNAELVPLNECEWPIFPAQLWPNDGVSVFVEPWRASDVIAKFNLSVSRGIAWLEKLQP